MSIFDYSIYAINQLQSTPNKDWGSRFVQLRTDFNLLHPHETFSTSHGIDFFENIISHAGGISKWEEKGEYGQNFRKLIDQQIKHISLVILSPIQQAAHDRMMNL